MEENIKIIWNVNNDLHLMKKAKYAEFINSIFFDIIENIEFLNINMFNNKNLIGLYLKDYTVHLLNVKNIEDVHHEKLDFFKYYIIENKFILLEYQYTIILNKYTLNNINNTPPKTI